MYLHPKATRQAASSTSYLWNSWRQNRPIMGQEEQESSTPPTPVASQLLHPKRQKAPLYLCGTTS